MADLPIDKPPSIHLVKQEDIPSNDDMGLNDPQNIAYVNLHAEGLPERFRERVAELEHMLRLTYQLVTIHTGTQVKRRIEEGVLPSDSSEESKWRRAAYRVRVMEDYFQDSVYPWLVSPGGSSRTQAVSVEKTRFHWELLSQWLVGIVLPRPIAASLEAVLRSIGETIQNTRDTSTNRTFLGLLQVFTYDEVRDDILVSYRGINYTLDQKMHEVVRRKSSQTVIEAAPTFIQANYLFNEHTWNMMKSEVEKYITEAGVDNIRDPLSVPV